MLSRHDRYSGELLHVEKRFYSLNMADKIKTINYDLHTGSALGLSGKVLGFLAGLTAATLPLTGLIIWLGKGKSLKKK